jgi:hypothetical protein
MLTISRLPVIYNLFLGRIRRPLGTEPAAIYLDLIHPGRIELAFCLVRLGIEGRLEFHEDVSNPQRSPSSKACSLVALRTLLFEIAFKKKLNSEPPIRSSLLLRGGL